ncbi:MAG: cobalamin transport system ATP-binding protein [Chloroflexota bacterium]|nr:cobalamin transport system ATP-binding protein [Chloroflexota bacterium]
MLMRTAIQQAGYTANTPVLHDIRFELPPGRVLAVIGPNGCGKTTLIRAISGVLPSVQGECHINGTDLLRADETERARLLAVVPQSTYIPPAFTVEEVVLMGRTPHLNWLGTLSARDTDIAHEAMRLTDVESFAGRWCDQLSAGERQRVILARALAQDTPVLMMDEPTSHLDLRYQIEFLEITQRLASQQDKTILIALHDLNLAARFGDTVMAMKDGRVAASGSAAEVLVAERIQEIYGLPVEVFQSPGKQGTIILPV